MPNTLNFSLQKSRRFELDSYKQQEKNSDPGNARPTYSAVCCFTTSALRHEVSSVGSRTVPAAGWKYVKIWLQESQGQWPKALKNNQKYIQNI